MKINSNGWLKIIILILITVATILFTLPYVQNYRAAQLKLNEVTIFQSEIPDKIPTTEHIHSLNLRDMLDIKGQNKNVIGRILIPSVGLSDDIYVGLTNGNLGIGAVTMFPYRTPQRHNIVLLGHNVGFTAIHFGVLKRVKLKNTIYMQYLNHDYQYEITSIETIKETEIGRVADTKYSQLSLVTCSAPTTTPNRLLVQARLVKELQKDNDNNLIRSIVDETTKKNRHELDVEMWRAIWLPILMIIVGYGVIIKIVLGIMNNQKIKRRK